MLGAGMHAGLRELLAGKIRFADAIHRDRQTSAHVLPAGSQAEGSEPINLDRLPSIRQAVTDSYDFQIYDCGYAGAEGLKLVTDIETIVMVSCEGASTTEVAETVDELAEAGFEDTILVHLDASDREASLAGAAA